MRFPRRRRGVHMLTALFDEDEAADLEKLFEVIEQIKIDPSTKLHNELYG